MPQAAQTTPSFGSFISRGCIHPVPTASCKKQLLRKCLYKDCTIFSVEEQIDDVFLKRILNIG